MLSKELGTRLTGQHLLIETYPFSFQEYLLYQQELSDRENHAYLTTKNQALSLDQSDTIHAEDKIIKVLPIYKWILLGD